MDNQDSIRTLAKGAGIVLLSVFVSKVFSYLYRLVLARGLGPAEYGTFSIGFALVSIITTIAVFGLPTALERYIPGYTDKNRIKGLLLFSLNSSTIIGFICLALSFILKNEIITFFKNSNIYPSLWVFLLAIPFLNIVSLYGSVSRAFKRADIQAITQNLLFPLLNLVFAAFAIFVFDAGILGIAIAFLLSYVISSVFIFLAIETRVFSIAEKIKPLYEIKEILLYSWPLVGAGLLGSILLWTDTLMLGYFVDASQVGLYNAAVPTANLLQVIPMAVTTLFLPLISELLHRGSESKIHEMYNRITKWLAASSIPLFLILFVFSKQILVLLFGATYSTAGEALSILSIGFLALALAAPAFKILDLFKRTKLHLFNHAIAAISNVALNLYLIPSYGIKGSAIASATSLVLMAILLEIQVFWLKRFKTFNWSFIKIVVVSVVPMLLLWWFSKNMFEIVYPMYLIPLFLIYIGIYTILLLKLKVIDDYDMGIIHSIIKKLNIFRINFFGK